MRLNSVRVSSIRAGKCGFASAELKDCAHIDCITVCTISSLHPAMHCNEMVCPYGAFYLSSLGWEYPSPSGGQGRKGRGGRDPAGRRGGPWGH